MTVLSADEQAALADMLGSPVAGAEIMFERWHVVWVSLADGRTVVVKRARAADDRPDPLGLAREWASLELLAGMPLPVAPRLLGGSLERSLMVLEVLPPGRTLAEVLILGTPVDAEAALVAYARSLAEVHAWTQGRQVPGLDSTPVWAQRVLAADSFGTAAERADVARLLTTSGDRSVLVHGDPCPDNVHLATAADDGEGRAWLMDFERTSFGSAALDLAYLIAPWPSCWCFATLPPTVAEAAVAAYRSVRPDDDPDLGEAELAAALAAYLVNRVDALDRLDRNWGTTTLAPRLRAWTSVFLAAPASRAWPGLRSDAQSLHDRLADAAPVAYPALPRYGHIPVISPDGWLPQD